VLLREFILPKFPSAELALDFRRASDQSKFEMRRFFLFFGVAAFSAHTLMDWMVGEDSASSLMLTRIVGSLAMLLMASAFCIRQRGYLTDSRLISTYLAIGALTLLVQTTLVSGLLLGIWPMGLIIVLGFGASILAPPFHHTAIIVGATFVAHWIVSGFSDIPEIAMIVHGWLLTIGLVSIVIGVLVRERLERASFFDALSLKELNQDLEASRVEAEIALKTQREFIGTMTHELRTPLNAVIGFSDFMLTAPYGPLGHPEYETYLGMIKDAGERQLANVDDLLDLRRLETGKMSWEDSFFSLHEAVQASVSSTQTDAATAGVEVIIDQSVSDTTVWSDRRRFIQVVNNLLTNAFRWTENGGRVVIRSLTKTDGRLRLSVEDTGCGISADDLERIQEMFSQAGDGSASVAKGGLGVGLAIVKGILGAMDSQLIMESAIGVGTTCHVDIDQERIISEEMKQAV
jgi:signal transduction histidine kinase